MAWSPTELFTAQTRLLAGLRGSGRGPVS